MADSAVPLSRRAERKRPGKLDLVKKAQQQALLAIFPVIHELVKDLLGKQMDALAREFAATHDTKVKEEIERLAKEYGKLKEPWVFAAR